MSLYYLPLPSARLESEQDIRVCMKPLPAMELAEIGTSGFWPMGRDVPTIYSSIDTFVVYTYAPDSWFRKADSRGPNCAGFCALTCSGVGDERLEKKFNGE